MEFLIFALGVFLLWALIKPNNSSNKKNSSKEERGASVTKSAFQSTSSKKAEITTASRKIHSGEFIEHDACDYIEQDAVSSVHHYLHVTHEWSKPETGKNKDHTEKVWNDLGYQIKSGEHYSYKHYGRKIYTPNQVEKIGSYRACIASSELSEKQIRVKTLGSALVKKMGSKRKAKDILVEEYGFSENTAKYAAGYRGYDDY